MLPAMAGPAVKHLAVRLGVDCAAGRVVGRARYRAEGGAGGGPLELDVRDLDVQGCWEVGPGGERGAALEFSVSEPPHKVLGSKLRIPLPAGSAAVEVAFAPRPSSSALQFLKPEQTAGKVHPFCFTQCQAIHARSFIPCQDVPGTKMTYTAAVHCTEGLTALMGALPREGAPEDVAPIGLPEGVTEQQPVFYFEQPVPISACECTRPRREGAED